MSANSQIREVLERLQTATGAANEAAAALTDEVLIHERSLISEATIARETATLLHHLAQNLGRTTLAALDRIERKEALHDT